MKRFLWAFAMASALIVSGCEKAAAPEPTPTPTPTPEPTPAVRTTPVQVRAYVTSDILKYADVKIYADSQELKYTVENPDWTGKDALLYSTTKSSTQALKAAEKDPDMFFKVLVSTTSVTVSSDTQTVLKGTLTRNTTALPLDGTKLYIGTSMLFAPMTSGVEVDDFLFNSSNTLNFLYTSGVYLGDDTDTAEERFKKMLSAAVMMKCRVRYNAQ